MSKADEQFHEIIVESYWTGPRSGLHGPIHVRPARGQIFPQNLHVECSKRLVEDYPLGTTFRLKVKLTDREGRGEFLYSNYQWKFHVVKLGETSK